MDKHVLVGKTIKSIYLADDQEAIRFVLDDGTEIIARCDGDCCSHTWIEDVLDPEAAVGVVMLAENIELPEHMRSKTTTDNYEEEMEYYGFAIETLKGRCTIGYRNSSNGYYGGSLSWPPDDYYYGGVFGQNISKENWKLIGGTE